MMMASTGGRSVRLSAHQDERCTYGTFIAKFCDKLGFHTYRYPISIIICCMLLQYFLCSFMSLLPLIFVPFFLPCFIALIFVLFFIASLHSAYHCIVIGADQQQCSAFSLTGQKCGPCPWRGAKL